MEANQEIRGLRWPGFPGVLTLRLRWWPLLQKTLCCRTCQHCSGV